MSDSITAIITVAGFSSRMNAFKPLLPICSATIVETAINSFHSVGARDIVEIMEINR